MSVLLFNLERPELEYFFHEMIQAFEPGIKNVLSGEWDGRLTQTTSGNLIEYKLEWKEKAGLTRSYPVKQPEDLENNGIYKGFLYDFLSEYYQQKLMWGNMTGIKPVKIVQKLKRSGLNKEELFERLIDYYRLSSDRARLLIKIAQMQEEFIKIGQKKNKVGIYVGVPLCPSKCAYCSFVSTIVDRKKENLRTYFNNLLTEIKEVGKVIKEKGLEIDTLYIGGGTPTVLDEEQLEGLFKSLQETFELGGLREFTLEAGRTDTLTVKKLELAKAYGVTRICLNPQSMNQKTLQAVARPCQVEDINRYAKLIRELNFKLLNMDLIVGLGDEEPQDFFKSLDQVMAFKPENITIHNLAIKKGSKIRNDFGIAVRQGYGEAFYQEIKKRMVQSGYEPYYLYRQKYTLGNSENIGYALSGSEGVYNIMMMSESQTIIGIGAGATGNLYDEETDQIKKVFTVKDVKTYNDRFEELLAKKITAIETGIE